MDVFVNLQFVQIHLNISSYIMIRDITLISGYAQISLIAKTISLLYLTLDGVALNFQNFDIKI